MLRKVLNSILNPNLPLGEGIFDPEEKVVEQEVDIAEDDENVKEIEKDAVRTAEAGDIKRALQLFDQARARQ